MILPLEDVLESAELSLKFKSLNASEGKAAANAEACPKLCIKDLLFIIKIGVFLIIHETEIKVVQNAKLNGFCYLLLDC